MRSGLRPRRRLVPGLHGAESVVYLVDRQDCTYPALVPGLLFHSQTSGIRYSQGWRFGLKYYRQYSIRLLPPMPPSHVNLARVAKQTNKPHTQKQNFICSSVCVLIARGQMRHLPDLKGFKWGTIFLEAFCSFWSSGT